MEWGFTRSYGIYVPSGGNNFIIKGNSIYNTGINGQNVQTALSFLPGSSSTGNIISQNWIGGSSAQCGTGGSVSYWGNSWDNYYSGENQGQGIVVNAGTVSIDSNNITNILWSNSDYSGFVCISIEGSTVASVTNNNLCSGSNGLPDNSKIIQVEGGGISGGSYPGYIYGVWNKSNTTSATTYNKNNFWYLWQRGAVEGGNVHCIFHQTAGPATITNNVINGAQASGRNWNSFGFRVEPSASTSGNLIEGNSVAGPYINSLVNGGVVNSAIYVKVLSTYTVSGTIDRNVVWDMRSAERGGASEGIYVWTSTGGNGNWNIHNNMVTLKNNGSTSNCIGLYGIEVDLNSSSTTNVQYNSVYISGSNGGTAVSGVDFSSYGYFRQPNSSGTVVGDALTLKNNIFINTRLVGNGFVTGHSAIGNVGASNFATNWNVSDSNLIVMGNSAYSRIGQWGGNTYSTLGTWRTASGKDANSYTATYTAGSSNFGSNTLNPENLFATPLSDLHISTIDGNSSYFVNNRATPISITTDYDGETRNATSPDIGADEFGSVNDAGVIAITPNCSGSSVDITIKNFGSAVLTSFKVDWSINGTNQPQQTYTSQSVASGATIVKTIVLTLPASFAAATAYNVVAYTTLPNGVPDENTSNDSYTANPLYYGLGATVYIGTGTPSFATYSALFNAINNSVLTQDLSVIVNANSSEPATPVFLNATSYCGGTRAITITPSSATVRTAEGTSGTASLQGMIGFNGAANVTIDGNYSGAGQYLRFRNTNSSRPVFAFQNDANTISVSNSVIEGNNSTTYVSGGISSAPGTVFFGMQRWRKWQ
ncbi:MAG: hypothetical protein IPP77_01925 [Bacteroidetes bacterium]|nr:hypothetical protein [Bacteroidota bacterium]